MFCPKNGKIFLDANEVIVNGIGLAKKLRKLATEESSLEMKSRKIEE
jgi:hypothetical protein